MNSSEYFYQCLRCNTIYPWKTLRYRCECQGLFQWIQPLQPFDTFAIEHSDPSMLRYRHRFPTFLQPHLEAITLGEGWTKTIQYSGSSSDRLWVKMDHLMPSFSFKDRGAVMLVAMARAIQAKRIVQDSSGNAGHAIALYAARANIACEIFVPQGTSSNKIKMMEIHGAQVHVVPGSREDTADATLAAASAPNTFYASHVYNPLFFEGTKTYIYELFEQFQGKMPKTLVMPVGNGTMILGAYLGLLELQQSKQIDSLPRLVAVQASPCAPIAKSFHQGHDTVDPVTNQGTIAEGIAIGRPLRGAQILTAIRATHGTTITAEESDILPCQEKLARIGLFVEPTTAATFAAFERYQEAGQGRGVEDEPIVIPICGAGMKSVK